MVPESDGRATATEFARQFQECEFDDAVTRLSDEGREAVVEDYPEEFQRGPMDAREALEGYWHGLYGQYGESAGVGDSSVDGGEVTVELCFEDGSEAARLAVGEDGVASFSFAPEYAVPDYVDESTVVEREVGVDADDATLDGVLTVPEGDGPVPGVLLVHGAGLHDRDGTAGSSKILKDLAWGLATEGIASLRYEKRLADHDVDDENFTVDRVVAADAVAALDSLLGADDVDRDAVFVAGHSQGGMCAPRIADRHGEVSGVVILDGPADPTLDPEDADFLRYELDPEGDLTEEQDAQLESQVETVRRIAEGDFTDDETIMGKPGTWHRSTKQLDPAGTASDLDSPVFVLRTGRADEETQPELADYFRQGFEEWQAVDLLDGSRVEFYDGLDHYFQAGPTPAVMQSLYFGGNVDSSVVTDVSTWIHGVAEH
ncbi:alpha/beta hydrolase family protein [Halobacteriales archaeon Cl-PHB]